MILEAALSEKKGSDKYLVWSKKHIFVCHLHKGDDPGCDWITELSGVVYRVNSMGPKTEPWGTSQEVGSMSEKQLPILTCLAFISKV